MPLLAIGLIKGGGQGAWEYLRERERERERERPKRTWKYNRTVVVVERKGKNGNYN
jgi:hypothetical protein